MPRLLLKLSGEALAGGAAGGIDPAVLACLRALELDADLVLKATKVDGVYTADPVTDPDAVRFDELEFDEALARRLEVMDATALCLCRDNALPVIVFDMNAPDALTRIASGDKVGTRIVSKLEASR